MILSSIGTDPDAYDTSFPRKQVLFVAAGVVGMVLVTLVDYRRLRDFAWLPYGRAGPPGPGGVGGGGGGTQAWFQIAFQSSRPSSPRWR